MLALPSCRLWITLRDKLARLEAMVNETNQSPADRVTRITIDTAPNTT
jgi:hypothetical protein